MIKKISKIIYGILFGAHECCRFKVITSAEEAAFLRLCVYLSRIIQKVVGEF